MSPLDSDRIVRPMDFPAWAREVASRMEAALAELLPPQQTVPNRLHDAMRYATLGGGKRVRAMLVFGAGELVEATSERLRIPAAAVELIHAYSLIHDDLPCMDDDVLRRGKPTCHVEFDEATALLAGDALQSLAFQILSEYRLSDRAEDQLKLVQLFAIACGSRGMAGGQAIDLDAVGKQLSLPELEHMHILKTGALIRASVMMGAYCGRELSAAEHEKLDRFGKCIGSHSRSWTTSSTRKAMPERSARPWARTGRRENLPIRAFSDCRKPSAFRQICWRRRTRPFPLSAPAQAASRTSRTSSCDGSARLCPTPWAPIPCSRASAIPGTCARWIAGSSCSSSPSCAPLSSIRSPRPAATCPPTSARSSSPSRCTTCFAPPRTG